MELNNGSLTCPVCTGPVTIALTRKSNGFHFRCVRSGKHFRGFIMDRDFLEEVLKKQRGL